MITGRTTPDVETVTLTTSRGTRTLVPDPRSHLFMTVFDGNLPSETLKSTALLRDGTTVTVLQPTGG